VLPAHNEAESIAETLREFHATVTRLTGLPLRFVVSEDGSTDGTADVVRGVAADVPLVLLSEPQRKGYSRAVIDGFRRTDAPLVAFIDSDGQCDPADFPRLLAALPEHDLVVGYRVRRADPWIRRAMSGAFRAAYRLLFPVRLRDPSCPYLLIRRPALERVLRGRVGILKQGFWWEFVARAGAAGLRVVEVPVQHRERKAGSTQVYWPRKVPRIALEHLVGLVQLRRELRRGGAGS